MKLYWFVCLILIVLFTSNCNTTHLKPPKPIGIAYVEQPKPLSTLSIPISMNMVDISNKLNLQLGDQLYSDPSFDDNGIDNIMYTITKREAIVIRAIGNSIEATVPLKINATYRFRRTILGKTINKEQSINLNLTAIAKTIPSINPNWELSTKTNTTIRWDDLPVFEFAGQRLDLPQLFAQAISSQTQQLSNLIDTEIPKQVKLREEISKIWPKLTQPYLIDEPTNSWFIIRPSEFYYTPFTSVAGNLNFSIGISSLLELLVGTKPEPEVFKKLPRMLLKNRLDNSVKISLNAQVSFETMNSLLQEQLKSPQFRSFQSNDYAFDILEASIYPNGNTVSLGIKLKGWAKYGKRKRKIEGLLYIDGMPYYDAQTQSLQIKQLAFNIKTKDLLVKSASWIINVTPLMTKLEKSLVFSVSKEMELAKAKSSELLNKQYGDLITIQGVINQIIPQPAIITPTHLRMDILAEGNLKVLIGKLAK